MAAKAVSYGSATTLGAPAASSIGLGITIEAAGALRTAAYSAVTSEAPSSGETILRRRASCLDLARGIGSARTNRSASNACLTSLK
jgi:hypothetical protein